MHATAKHPSLLPTIILSALNVQADCKGHADLLRVSVYI